MLGFASSSNLPKSLASSQQNSKFDKSSCNAISTKYEYKSTVIDSRTLVIDSRITVVSQSYNSHTQSYSNRQDSRTTVNSICITVKWIVLPTSNLQLFK